MAGRLIEKVPEDELRTGLDRVTAALDWLSKFEAEGAMASLQGAFPEQATARDLLIKMSEQIGAEFERRSISPYEYKPAVP